MNGKLWSSIPFPHHLSSKNEQLQKDIEILQKFQQKKNNSNPPHPSTLELKRLRNETEYDSKKSRMAEEISKKKQEFRQLQKELLQIQKDTTEEHRYLVSLAQENAELKWVNLWHKHRIKIKGKPVNEGEKELKQLNDKLDKLQKALQNEVNRTFSKGKRSDEFEKQKERIKAEVEKKQKLNQELGIFGLEFLEDKLLGQNKAIKQLIRKARVEEMKQKEELEK